MNHDSTLPVPLNTPESWEAAKKIAGAIGQVPSSFTSSIRTLRGNFEQNKRDGGSGLSSNARFLVSRICRSTSMSAPVYYLARTFRPDVLPPSESLTPKSLVALFSPEELAAALGIVYMLRRVKKVCDHELWGGLTKQLCAYSEIGGFLGLAQKNLGLADGLLLGSMQHLGLALLMKGDEKKTREFKRKVKNSPLPFEYQAQAVTWGCTSAQVGSVLIQAAGFGVDLATAFSAGLTASDTDSVKEQSSLLRMKTMDIWLQTLFATGKIPEMTHRGEYYPLKPELDRLVGKVSAVRSGDTNEEWLLRGKEDLSPSSFPGLCGEDTDKESVEGAQGASDEAIKEISEE